MHLNTQRHTDIDTQLHSNIHTSSGKFKKEIFYVESFEKKFELLYFHIVLFWGLNFSSIFSLKFGDYIQMSSGWTALHLSRFYH